MAPSGVRLKLDACSHGVSTRQPAHDRCGWCQHTGGPACPCARTLNVPFGADGGGGSTSVQRVACDYKRNQPRFLFV